MGVMLILGIATVAAIGVPMNALFFQDGRHPAPLFSAEPSNVAKLAPTPPTRPAAIEAARIERETGVQARPASKDAIASKLEKLDASLQAGKAEPAKADLTRAADKTRDAIGQLIIAKAPPAASADKAEKPEKPASADKTAAIDRQHVLYAQRALLRLGYVVRADGVWNSATRRALEKFERDAGLPAKGQITPRLLQQLATLSGLARP